MVLLLLPVPYAQARPLKGDVNGDGRVDLGDVILTLRIAAGLTTANQEQLDAADVSPYPGVGRIVGDGLVQVSDAVRLLRFVVGLLPLGEITGEALVYVGSERCATCHSSAHQDEAKSGHPNKLRKVIDGQPPKYPFSEVPSPPEGYTWQDITYVIGGYGWKARFLDKKGYIITGAKAQYNLATKSWVAYEAARRPGPSRTIAANATPRVGRKPDLMVLIKTTSRVYTVRFQNPVSHAKHAMALEAGMLLPTAVLISKRITPVSCAVRVITGIKSTGSWRA
jgi:hypothetical protein